MRFAAVSAAVRKAVRRRRRTESGTGKRRTWAIQAFLGRSAAGYWWCRVVSLTGALH